MDAWGKLFTDDVDYVNRRGASWQSNKENIEGHKILHERLVRQKSPMAYKMDAAKVTFLKPDLALVQATWEWPGFIQRSGEAIGDFKGIITMVMVKQHEKWLIRSSQNTVAGHPVSPKTDEEVGSTSPTGAGPRGAPKLKETSMTLPYKPEDWPRVFEQHLNAGDLDSVMALSEPEARFVTKTGETLADHDRIRDTLGGMIRSKIQLQSRVLRTITVGDIAQLYTDFEGTAGDASGKTSEVRYKAIEVLRRQPDASWEANHGRLQCT
jgi:uncharacterized protein (TIGR02246 family)